ncbi:site-specific integrase [Yinghuangia sp. ASG 101]|uniref:tyrosine-type recombinase/integrase n=1 Tax=Yinghuangia sp. ASG 101 TaxID=2896848 RepID=UPI001E284A5B|nr:site-specific integrase [Yinghuangia sp. ASG 101]UGQ15021.1 site-specific integrase [Yinghuangia sp. ASG 101]
MKGSTKRRCGCRNPETGKQWGTACPQRRKKDHGTWLVRQELPPDAHGNRRTFRRSGYTGALEAQADLDHIRALLALPEKDDTEGRDQVAALLEQVARDKAPLPTHEDVQRKLNRGLALNSRATMGEWLDAWIEVKRKAQRKTTANSYESHVRVHLKPRIGHIRVERFNVAAAQALFDAIDDENETIASENAARRAQEERCRWHRTGRPPADEARRLDEERAKLDAMPPYRRLAGAATKQRIRATLRAALSAAIARGLTTFNAASHVELESGKRPKAVLWTPAHEERWRETGARPSRVMVWRPDQLAAFLDVAERHRLYALWHLMAFRGLRRGEAVGQDWVNVDLDGRQLTVARTIIVDGGKAVESEPKTDDSADVVSLDTVTVAVLRKHRARQNKEKLRLGDAWANTGKVFTREDGEWLHPEQVSDAFHALVREAGLPPINLRDLRHVAATVVHAGGGDLHTIKEVLRHSTIKLASDTYTSLLREVDQESAEAAAKLVHDLRRKVVGEPGGLTSGSPGPKNAKVSRPLKLGRDTNTQVNKGFSA